MGSMDKAVLTGFICRICSKMNKVVFHVYGEEGKKIDLANQLQNYLGVDIYFNDQLPKTVCNSCIVKLKIHYEWMQSIKKAQKQIKSKDGAEWGDGEGRLRRFPPSTNQHP